MNIFRCPLDKSLDKDYLRVCAVYKLLKIKRINKERAIELLPKNSEPKALVEMWLEYPLKHIN